MLLRCAYTMCMYVYIRSCFFYYREINICTRDDWLDDDDDNDYNWYTSRNLFIVIVSCCTVRNRSILAPAAKLPRRPHATLLRNTAVHTYMSVHWIALRFIAPLENLSFVSFEYCRSFSHTVFLLRILLLYFHLIDYPCN